MVERIRYPKQAPGTVRVYWLCSSCQLTGLVDHPPGASVGAVANLLDSSHAARSPACAFDIAKLQVSPKPIRKKPTAWGRR